MVPIGCTDKSGIWCGPTTSIRDLVDIERSGEPERRDRRQDHLAGACREENLRRPAEPEDELRPIGVV